jgi:hypothetical protein
VIGISSEAMDTSQGDNNLRQSIRWGVAAAASAFICVLWFAYLNRDGCWFHFRGARGLIVFVFPWLWLMLLFGFPMKARFVLIALTLFGLFFWQPPDSFPAAAAESRAVTTLRQLCSELESLRVGQKQTSYPRTLPNTDFAYPVQRAYRFKYVPSFSANGLIEGYVIEATPVRRACGCTRSFTITDGGRLYYTLEDRAATISDEPPQ